MKINYKFTCKYCDRKEGFYILKKTDKPGPKGEINVMFACNFCHGMYLSEEYEKDRRILLHWNMRAIPEK